MSGRMRTIRHFTEILATAEIFAYYYFANLPTHSVLRPPADYLAEQFALINTHY